MPFKKAEIAGLIVEKREEKNNRDYWPRSSGVRFRSCIGRRRDSIAVTFPINRTEIGCRKKDLNLSIRAHVARQSPMANETREPNISIFFFLFPFIRYLLTFHVLKKY